MNSRKLCQYKENCYRKNPAHFKEYSHPHLEKILNVGVNQNTNKYEIPPDLFMSKDIVQNQLKILEDLFPNLKNTNVRDVSKNKTSEETLTSKLKKTTDIIVLDDDLDMDCNTASSNIKVTQITKTRKEVEDHKDKISLNNSISVNNNVVNSIDTTSPKKRNLPVWTTSSKNSAKKENDNKCDDKAEESKEPCQENSSNHSDTSHLSKKVRIDRNIHDYIQVVVPKGNMENKLKEAAPYNFFLTTITDSKPTHNEPLSITFQEILDESLGEIESSLQINFMVDVGWLLGHYYFGGCLDKPLTILYGDETPELQNISKHKPQVTAFKINMPSPFATHHTKMMIFNYKDKSMRVVISTANLYEDDWHNRTQGIWMSPKLPALPENSNTSTGDSLTSFRQDLMLYLVEYKISKIQPWIAQIRKTDFSSINVFFVASVPGGFRSSSVRGHPYGHARLGQLLGKYSTKIDESVAVVAQSSSIGSLGPNVQNWIENDFVNSLRKDSAPLGIRRIPQFKFIYPSFGNVKSSHDDLLGGGCLPYGKNTDDKQPWLKNHFYQWKAKSRNRNRAMPHIKTYCRWHVNDLYWFVLTSANLSKAAWGSFNKNSKIEPALRIMNYEVGVLFIPKFVTGEETFPLHNDRNGVPAFPMPYDIPLHPYRLDDKPFLMDYLRS